MDNASKRLFKTAVVGGFNREDVAIYIEHLSNQHMEEMQEMRNQLKAAAAQNIDAKGQLETLQAEKAAMESRLAELERSAQECANLSEKLSVAEAANEGQAARIATSEKELSVLRQECQSVQEKLAGYINMENELGKSKARIADLELSALQRADEVEATVRARMQEKEAKHQADMDAQMQEFAAYRERTYREVEKLVSEISGSYLNVKSAVGGFKTGFKEVVSVLAREIDHVSEACGLVEQSFGDLCKKCTNMKETCGIEDEKQEEAPASEHDEEVAPEETQNNA